MAFPGTYNFSYYRGDTFEFIIRPRDAAGDPFPLEDFTAEFTIADRRGAGTTLDPAIQYEGTAVINTVDGIVTCTISDSVGRNLTTARTWVYDVQIEDGSSVFTLLNGEITVRDDITGAIA
jgi:hypothetical protein